MRSTRRDGAGLATLRRIVDEQPKTGTATPARRPSARPWAQRFAWAIVLAWLAACAGIVGAGALGVRVRGELDGLLPPEHRAPADQGYLLLRHDGDLTRDELLSIADRVHEVLGPAWVPVVAPAAERNGWLDAHALYLLPLSTHDALRERLSDENIRSAVDALRSTMSSPFFGLTMSESRRDPLRLRDLTAGVEARSSWDAPALASRAAPTPAGDLLADDGQSLLLSTRGTRPASELAELVAHSVSEAVIVEDVGPRAQRDDAVAAADAALRKTVWIALVGIIVVLAAAHRNVRRTLAAALCLGSGAAACLLFVPLDPISAPLLVLAIGIGSGATLPLARLSGRGWAGLAILAVALTPLMVLDYTLWVTWAPLWVGVVLVMRGMTRVVMPALLEVLRVGPNARHDRRARFLLRPSSAVALSLSLGLLASGWWGLGGLEYRGVDRLEFAPGNAARRLMRETYFDPGLVAHVDTEGTDVVQALTRSADDARLLATLVPTEARVVDTPGALVLPSEELQRRAVGLAELKLGERLTKLRELLSARGFRPAAFGEFLRSAADPDRLPTPEAALEGPLGPWIRGYVVDTGSGVVLQARVHLAPDPDVLPPALETPDGRTLLVQGPAIGGRMQAATFFDQLGLATGALLWIGAFVVWLAMRQFSAALAAAIGGTCVLAGMLAALRLLEVPASPVLLPVFLLAAATAVVAAAGACRAAGKGTPVSATGLLAAGLAQSIAGLALAASSIPVWVDVGVAAAAGSLLASGVGLFVAPGLATLLERNTKEATSP